MDILLNLGSKQRNRWHKTAWTFRSVGFCRGSRVEGRGSRVEGRGSRVEGRGSRVEGRGSRVEGRGSRVEGRGGGEKCFFVWSISIRSKFSHILGVRKN